MKKSLLLSFLLFLVVISVSALDIPAGKYYFDNSKTMYSNVKFVYGSNTRAECYVIQMTNEGDNIWSVTLAETASDMYRYTFAETSLADGNQGDNFNNVKDNISNVRNEKRTATRGDEVITGGIFVPSSGDNWAQGTWQTMNSFKGVKYSGTLPVLFINTTKTVTLPAVCTVDAEHYFAYYENTEGWSTVHCYAWDSNYNNLNGDWTGMECEKVGTADNGNEIWRWVSTQKKSEAASPGHIIFNDGQQVGGQTGDMLFQNGGYYTFTASHEVGPDIVLTGDGVSEEVVPITSKEEYVQGTYYIDALGLSGYSNLGSKDEPLALEIKGRGNYTWRDFDKKPYRLKFDKKAQPLGMKKSKHFTLLAHADDNLGFLRNTVGFQLSRLLGLAYTPEQQPVEVVLNGDYIGLYMMTDQLRIDPDRVNIVEQADEETDPEKITGGWLLEIDNYEDECQVRLTEGNGASLWVTYKTPELLSSAQENYLKNLIQTTDNAIYASNKNSTTWESYIDMDALARFYIIQEVMDNAESFHGSCYMHKEQGADTKLIFGPVWDFGNSYHRGYNKFIYVDSPFGQTWIGEIAKFPRFQSKVKELWKIFFGNQYLTLDAFIDQFVDQISQAAVADADRWPSYGNANMTNRKASFKNAIAQKTEYLRQQWGDGVSGIDNITTNETGSANAKTYSIDGREVNGNNLSKGIYIRNGKKFVVK